MKKIKILPNNGVLIEDIGEIHFGFSKTNIELLLGKPESEIDNVYAYFENSLHFVFDAYNKVSLIDLRSSKLLSVRLFNRNIFTKNEVEITTLFASKNMGRLPDVEGYFSYPSLGISFSMDNETGYLKQILLTYKNNDFS